jgi:hypothetical protein
MTRTTVSRIPGDHDADPIDGALRALAADQFSASPAVLARIERTVLEQFRGSVRGATAAPSWQAEWERRGRAKHRPLIGRRRLSATLLGLVAALLVAGSTALASAASTPGRPLFGLRLAVEEALLPGQSPADRLDAEMVRLERRLAEATEVASDADAAVEAMRAYRATLSEARRLVRDAPARRVAVEGSLLRQLRTIGTLRTQLPERARPEIDAAADDADAVLAGLWREDRERSRERNDSPVDAREGR